VKASDFCGYQLREPWQEFAHEPPL
jgi:hypothetical protein